MDFWRFIRRLRRYFVRNRLLNKDFTIISNNCIAGLMYHDLHRQFISPTINLFFDYNEFLLFCEHLEDFISSPLDEVDCKEYGCPVGIIDCKWGGVRLFFLHYSSFEDARTKWEERKKRINWDNIFIVMEGDECTADMLMRFDNLPFKNKVVFTDGNPVNTSSTFPIDSDFYHKDFYPGKFLEYPKHGIRRYYEIFDYVHFLNTGKIRKSYV